MFSFIFILIAYNLYKPPTPSPLTTKEPANDDIQMNATVNEKYDDNWFFVRPPKAKFNNPRPFFYPLVHIFAQNLHNVTYKKYQ